MTVKGGTTPACAACKYQRRKCSPNCPLAPYFPANQPKMFRNVHRLFGVSNVTKTLETLKTKDLQEEAMTSIIYEAEMRERFPVHGCCAIIAHLYRQLHFATEELSHVRTQLQGCRDQMKPPYEFASGSGTPSGVNNQFFLNDTDSYFDNSPDNMTLDHGNSNLTLMHDFGFQERNIMCPRQDFEVICHDNYMTSPESSFEDTTPFVMEDGCRIGSRTTMAVVQRGCRREVKTAATGFSLTTFKF